MQPYYLEALVVVLGLALLMTDAFFPKLRKAALGWAGALGLLVVLAVLCFLPAPPSGIVEGHEMSRFYAFDSHAKFFKGFALLTTAIVLLMSIDYRKTLERFAGNSETPTPFPKAPAPPRAPVSSSACPSSPAPG